jgi:DNA helicase-2/ATP-dependent DNA helicase PcrA
MKGFVNFFLTEPQPSGECREGSPLEERSGWKRGQRLFHENYGYGAVMEIQDSEDGPVVRVRFDNGKETRFLSEYQGRAFEKMGDDC